MPLNLTSVPLSQVKKVPSQKKGRPANSPAKSTKQNATAPKRTTVTVATYGGKLFEPVMSREKPIYIHFREFVIQDDISITRFSEDGFFAIKYIIRERRCYLLYFLNPIVATEKTTIESACQEAIDYRIFEFEDSEAFIKATQCRAFEEITRLRGESALHQMEQKIVDILREKITAEKFLLQQRKFEEQDKDWKLEFARQQQLEEEEEKANELENRDGKADADELELESDTNSEREEESPTISEEVREEKAGDKLSDSESRTREGAERKTSFSWGKRG